MILVLGDTKESKSITDELVKLDEDVIVSVVTDYGYNLVSEFNVRIIRENLSQQDLTELVTKEKITMIIDATHPFASKISKNAIKVANLAEIDYLRFESRDLNTEYKKLVNRIKDYQEAINEIKDLDKVLLIIEKDKIDYFIKRVEDWKEKLIILVLPTWKFIKELEVKGFPARNLIVLGRSISKNLSKEILREYDISGLVIKDCGSQENIETKIEAATELGIPSFLISSEPLPTRNIINETSHVLRSIK